jgi:hypothetical protein
MKNIKHVLSIHAARLAVLLAVLAPAAAVKGLVSPPLVVTNGGFETGDFTDWTLSGAASITNRGHVLYRTIVDNGSTWDISPNSGSYAAYLGTLGAPGYLSQTLSTVPGMDYTLTVSFWMNNSLEDQSNMFVASFNGTTLFGATNLVADGWINIQTNILVTGPPNGSSVFQFMFEDDEDALGLDDVSVELLPPSPIGLQAVAGNNQVTLTWTASAGVKFTEYRVLRSMNSGGPWMQIGPDIVPGPGIVPTDYTYTDGGLVNGTTYYYEVAGQSDGGMVYSFVESATPVPPPPYTYTTNNGTITITGYTGSGGAVTIPDTINGLPVTTIGSGAFQNYSSLTNVTIGTNVTSIADSAFAYCTGLTNVTIGTNVTTIGDYAFDGCTSLNSIILPNSITSIGVAVFLGCTSLTNVAIPSSVTSLGDYAFAYCTSLPSVTIPGSVTNIGDHAFSGCTGLTGVYFQGKSPGLGGPNVFLNDVNTVYYLPGTTGWNAPTFDGRPAVLLNPPYLCTTANGAITIIGYTGPGGAVTIPDTINDLPVTTIGSGAFQNCASLTSVTIGTNVTSIGDSAFQNCSSLTAVYFLGNPPILGSSVFLNDNNAIGYNAAGTTGWGLPFDGLTMVLANNTTIDAANHYAYGANLGWLDWRGDASHGAVIGTNICSGYIYSANFGWISLGNGSPANGLHYQNNSASDFGVNVDGSGNLSGYAYGANIGWITFTNPGKPNVNLATGNMSGSVWSANWGWISLSNTVASVQTAALQQSAPTNPHFTSISVSGMMLTVKATNGTASGQYVLLGSTDVALPLSQWTPILTNKFDSGGCLNLSTNIINPAAQQEFYILKQ